MFSSGDAAGESVSNAPGLLALLVSLINIAWAWWSRGQTAAADRVKKIEDRLDVLEDRQLRVEGELKHLPTKDDIGGLSLKIENLLGKFGRLESETSKIDRTVNRIDDYLREKA